MASAMNLSNSMLELGTLKEGFAEKTRKQTPNTNFCKSFTCIGGYRIGLISPIWDDLYCDLEPDQSHFLIMQS